MRHFKSPDFKGNSLYPMRDFRIPSLQIYHTLSLSLSLRKIKKYDYFH